MTVQRSERSAVTGRRRTLEGTLPQALQRIQQLNEAPGPRWHLVREFRDGRVVFLAGTVCGGLVDCPCGRSQDGEGDDR